MSVLEVQETDPSLTYTGAGWASAANVAYSGGTAQETSGAGQSVSIAFTGRALYLVTKCTNNGGGQFSVTVDGVVQPGVITTYVATSNLYARIVVPVARGLDQGAHTVVLTQVAGMLSVDSVLVVSGGRLGVTKGTLVTVGDSWTAGSGAFTANTAYATRMVAFLQGALKRGVLLVNKGVSGDCWYAADATHVGGMYRIVTDVAPNTPEMITFLFGANDLHPVGPGVNPSDFARYVHHALCLVEDVFDTSQVRVAVGTPGYLTSAQSYQVAPNSYYAMSSDNIELAVALVRQVVGMFPWCRLAAVYEAMDGRDTLMYPNSSGDTGLHPNDTGHAVIGLEFARALLGSVA